MKSLNVVFAAVGLAFASSSVNAAIQSVSVSGATVDFFYQYDDAFGNLFNPGIYLGAGDTLSFSPTNFVAQKNGVTGWSTATATTPLITVTAKAGYVLTGLSLFEEGDYYRIQSGSNMTLVSVAGQFIVNGNPKPISPAQLLNSTLSASGLFDESETFQTSTWSVDSSVALNSLESATAKIQNILKAGINLNATSLDEAFIEKKRTRLSASTVPVAAPVPGALWLFGTALAGFLVSRTGKKTA